jgi:DNA-binding NarL/FixJ family response regulator
VEAVLAAAGHEKSRVRRNYPAQLSDHEVEVIALVARGLSNKEVADRLSISHKTVQRHMESIFAKTGVRSRAAAAVFAVDQRLVAAR